MTYISYSLWIRDYYCRIAAIYLAEQMSETVGSSAASDKTETNENQQQQQAEDIQTLKMQHLNEIKELKVCF